MGDGRLRRRRRKNSRRRAALAFKIEDVPDELFELVFLRLPLPVDLVRAACTCKRWRRIIAADDGHLIRSLHGAPSSHVVGHYRVIERRLGSRPPGRKPYFAHSILPSPWARILAGRNFALMNFLPRPESKGLSWQLADIRGGLLLFMLFSSETSDRSLASPLRLIACDPLARRYSEIPLHAWFHGYSCLGAFLRDGEDPGAPMSLSNFQVACVLYRNGIVRTSAFSSAGGSRWASGAGNDCWATSGVDIRFAGCGDDGSVAYWTIGGGGRILLSLDKEAAKLSSSFLPDEVEYAKLRKKIPSSKYAYKLSWPPTIRACLY